MEGRDGFVLSSVEAEYDVQICTLKHVGDMLVGGDQLEIATAISC